MITYRGVAFVLVVS